MGHPQHPETKSIPRSMILVHITSGADIAADHRCPDALKAG
jgi:hypothetical protein